MLRFLGLWASDLQQLSPKKRTSCKKNMQNNLKWSKLMIKHWISGLPHFQTIMGDLDRTNHTFFLGSQQIP
jgi:hypothetical protein